jgi:hypothetical protein
MDSNEGEPNAIDLSDKDKDEPARPRSLFPEFHDGDGRTDYVQIY